jgi:aminopeptidase N
MLQSKAMKQAKHLVKIYQPDNYKIELNLDPDKYGLEGKVVISGKTVKPTDKIILHSKNLIITSAQINSGDVEFKHNPATDELTLMSDKQIDGKAEISVTYSGVIGKSMVGVYASTFKHGSKDKTIISTQFESHHAREAFPCIDEPAAKAKFSLTLSHPSHPDTVAISNQDAIAKTQSNGRTIVSFDETPIMSSYLLAFVVGEIQCLEDKTKDGTIVRTWATPENYKKTKFALDVAISLIEFYNDYFEIPYPLEKCDMAAIPNFSAGAMENWGLVTYRESVMLVDENTTSLANKQMVALVVAHELAHQWFGNLVTMEWWTDLWLNEGFASWVEFMAVDKLFPEWDMWTEFVTDDFLRGQSLDSLKHSHPIEVNVPDPDEIRNIFDAISYNKGASVIRMLDSYLGHEVFRQGLVDYLKKHSYANAKTKDLWDALEAASSKPVSEFMSKWTSQTGFPLVKATWSKDKIELTQKRFMFIDADEQTTWPIPLTNSDTKESVTLSDSQDTWSIKTEYPILNKDKDSFIITGYDDAWLEALSKKLNNGDFSAIDRFGLLNDSFQLAKASQADTVSAIKLLENYDKEVNHSVWDVMASHLGGLRSVMGNDEYDELIRPINSKLADSLASRLGIEEKDNDDHFTKLLRPTVLAVASRSTNESIKNSLLELFQSTDEIADFNPNLRGLVLGVVSRDSINNDYKKMLNWYKTTQDAQLRSSLVGGLSGFKEASQVENNLNMLMTDAVRLQEVIHWLSFLMSNRHAKQSVWEWIQANWSWLDENFGTDIMSFCYIPRIVGSAFSTEDKITEYDKFFATVDKPGLHRAIEQGRESMQWKTSWRVRDQDKVIEYLKSYSK